MSSRVTAVLEPPSDLVALETSSRREKRVVLVGHPNVGKSLVFSRLTSRYVTVSNFPGTTVDVFRGHTWIRGQRFEILDTPGINSTSPKAEDERVTLQMIDQERPNLIVQVADAKNLRRTLLLTSQLASFQIPLVLVLNMMDECRAKGIQVDAQALSVKLGIPVLQSVATTGEGILELTDQLHSTQLCTSTGQDSIPWVEEILAGVQRKDEVANPLPARTRLFTLACLAGVLLHLENYLGGPLGIPTLAGFLTDLLRSFSFSIPEQLTLAVSLVGGYLLPVLWPVLWAFRVDPVFNERFGVWARKFSSGLLILAVTASLTFQLVGNLGAQILVELVEVGLFEAYVTPFLGRMIPGGFLHDLLIGQYGMISMGLAYGLAIVLPVVSTFFLAFSFLEDSGYLPRLSILSDRLLRAMGLNGKGFLPMVLGLGCVTLATMTTRILNSRKERFIATFLLALGVPCSAQLGVVLAITSGISVQALGMVFVTVLLQLLLVGHAISRFYPGIRSSFILELPPIRYPVWGNIAKKTYWRVRWFLKEALPLFALGAFVLFALDKAGLLGRLVGFLEPLMTRLLGLPGETATVFLMGFLRRDYGAAGLFDMARQGQLDTIQTVVGLVVMTLFVPCVANFFVMIKEQGLRNSLLMVGFILLYSCSVGVALNWFLRTLEVSL